MATPENKWRWKGSGGASIWLAAIVSIIAAAAVSWIIVATLAMTKTEYAAGMEQVTKQVDNTVGHLKDSTASLDNFTSFQNARIDDLSENTQAKLDALNSSIDTTSGKVSQAQDDLAKVKSQTDSLTTQYNKLNDQITTVSQAKTTLDSLTSTTNDNKNKLDNLTTKVNGITSGIQIVPSYSSGTITLTIQSSLSQMLAFRVDFRQRQTRSKKLP